MLEGQLLVAQGKPRDALNLLREEPPASLASTDVFARRKMVLGLAHGFSQELAEADRDLADAQQLAGSRYPDLLAEILLSRGTIETEEAKYAEADSTFHEALALARDKHLMSVQSKVLGSLGTVTMWQEHYDEAIDWYKASLQISQSIGAKDSSAITLGNMGWSYFSLGDFENALAYFKRAEDASAKTGLERGEVQWLTNAGNVYYEQRDYSSAEAAYRKALTLARKIDYKSAITECLDDLAQIALARGRLDDARSLSDQAIDLTHASQDHFVVPYSKLIEGRVEEAAKNYGKADQLFEDVIHDKNAGTSLEWEAEAHLAEVYASQGNRKKAGSQFQRSLETIESARSSVKTEDFRLSFLSSAISVYSGYIAFLVGEGKTVDALEVAELSRARTLADGLGFTSAALSFPIRGFEPTKTARALDSTILSYWLGAEHSYVWVITPSRVQMLPLPSAASIDSLVESYRAALTGPRDPLESGNAAGEKLYEILVAPAAREIPKGSRVIVVPDGSLYELNFEALPVSGPKPHYWIDDVTLANANSLVLLGASAHDREPRTRKLLLIGDPISSSEEFPQLPQAKSEMKEIESHFSPANRTVLSENTATPAAYLDSHPEQFSYIHFVAHGTASRVSPLDSAVILTKEGDSYKLYARDIITKPLRADLVTISACHGAGERTYSGEGLVGLSWAFLHAGAHQVISALWEVDDNSTPQLMSRFYAELSEGKPAEAALRDAKLALLHSDSVYRKPFYWAPFQIYRGL
ncbi:MAG TPA: CHAT domain-containing protein [Candidatus Limnocylindrales bacterium]|nr:CHAT domain-containing protein [Candidatus Limnocylindrales bacterium]